MPSGFELFDHTADIGIRAWGATPAELFEAAARGMYSVIGELAPEGESTSWNLELTGSDRADLLRKFLAELLFVFERDHLYVTGFRLNIPVETRLVAELLVSHVDWDCSDLSREVKAVTYHELAVKETSEGFEARVIVDI